ncbi:MAG: hypothetical protein ABI780_10960 [Ardenticatenales bacterium]
MHLDRFSIPPCRIRRAARLTARVAPVAPVALSAALLAALSLAAVGGRAEAQTRPNNPDTLMRQFGIATWSPAYTLQTLTADDEVVNLADDGRALWLSLMSRPRVVRFQDGAWWPGGEIDTQGVYFAYGLASAGADIWAVGHEGGMARRSNGIWTAIDPASSADLYAAVGTAADDVWAVGFDYAANAGAIVHWDGRAATLHEGPDLTDRLLFSAAIDPTTGAVWIGGCTAVADPTPLAWRRTASSWEALSLPAAHGCITDLAFAADGRALAAAGSDVLAWDGVRWTAFDLALPAADPAADPPLPEGLQWMRVALSVRETLEGPVVRGAAIAGRPTFRGFTAGAALWRYDGHRWTSAAVDDRGWDAAFLDRGEEPERAWLDVTARRDGTIVAAAALPSAQNQPVPVEGMIGLFALQDDALRLVHPLAGGGPREAAVGGDVAAIGAPAGGDGPVWFATARGSLPLRGAPDGWTADDRFRISAEDARWFVDTAGPDSAYAWRVAPRPGTTDLWSWQDGQWRAIDLPVGGGPRQLRDVLGGRLWARRDSDLIGYANGAWSRIPNAPQLPTGGLVCNDGSFPLGGGCDGLVAPFDATIGPGGAETGWAAGDDGALHQWVSGKWSPNASPVRGTVIDVQMAGPRAAWAIGRDDATTRPAATPRGVLLHLSGGVWTEVSASDLTVPRGDGTDQPARLIDVDWRLLAAVDANEALLYGVATFQFPVNPQVLPVLIQVRGSRAILLMTCPLSAIAAARADRATDIWLLDQGAQRACTRSPNGRLPIRREVEQPVTGFLQLLGHVHWAMPRIVHLPVVVSR